MLSKAVVVVAQDLHCRVNVKDILDEVHQSVAVCCDD